jgi:hypothetical protein
MQEQEWDRARGDVAEEKEAADTAAPEVNASAPPAERQQFTRQGHPVIR